MTNHDPNDWNATPDFDEWGWDTYWSKNDWITWHHALLNHYGEPEGSDRFVEAWNSRIGFWEALGDVRADWVAFDTNFREWLGKHRLSNGQTMLQAIESGVILGAPMGGVSDTVAETAGNVGEIITGTTGGVAKTAKKLEWILPLLLIAIVVVGAVYLINSNPLKLLK